MRRDNLNDLQAFLTVVRERSFTRAAAVLGVSQPALSKRVRALEDRIGVRLLSRTTRNVQTTEAGELLVARIAPAINDIELGLAELGELRDRPSGTIRLTSSQFPAESILWPAVAELVREHPDIKVEIDVSGTLVDIVEQRFDAGVRLGEQVAKDMIAVPISGETQMAVVGAPSYFARHPPPQTPRDLATHQCINLRLGSTGRSYDWEFQKDHHSLQVRVSGQLTFNTAQLMIKAAVEGFGLTCLTQEQVRDEIAAGRLVRVLAEWCPRFPGYHLYYPSRRQHSRAFALLLERLRYTRTGS